MPNNPRIPSNLKGWNLEIIRDLLGQGTAEDDLFDWKEQLPNKKDEDSKDGKFGLRKGICAFANSYGGFFIYGVRDPNSKSNLGLSVDQLIVGIDKNIDFPNLFGNFPRECIPSVYWTFKNLNLSNDRQIWVIHIEKSWKTPHGAKSEKDKAIHFMKRTNQGDDYMSIEEIRYSMLNYHERKLKLELVKGELNSIKKQCEFKYVRQTRGGQAYRASRYDLEVIKSVLAEIYLILNDQKNIIDLINNIRITAMQIDGHVENFSSISESTIEKYFKKHNDLIENLSQSIYTKCEECIKLIDSFLNEK
jgi:predicted HTH transcriptional regulator